MADALQTSIAAPVFKRPRLDFCPENGASESPFDSLSSEDGFKSDCELKPSTAEILSTDSALDMNGGDSGFHEQSLINGGGNSGIVNRHSGDVAYEHVSSDLGNRHAGDAYEHYSRNESDYPNIGINQHCDPKQNPRFDKDSDENDGEDVASTVSDLSGLSDLSTISGPDGKQNPGPYIWVQRQMENGTDPRALLMEILPKDTVIPANLNPSVLWRIVLSVINEPPPRTKLSHINTMNDVITLLRTCRKIMVLTGAGVSVSCGIPDFRSRNGVYARLSKDYPDLPDPQAMFDINYFRKDPRPFFKFAKEIYPGLFQPSPSHHFIRLIEKQGKLLRNYTQNIDTLEHAAGIEQVITCHGSFATATCTVCRYKVDASVIKDDIFTQRIPYCPVCPSNVEERGIMKPDIVFFGEGLSDEFHESLANDKEECDLLIVMGSSLKVRPVALIPSSLPPHVPQILINREPLRHLCFDVELLGDCDVIIGELCKRLAKEWDIKNVETQEFTQLTSLPPSPPPKQFQHFGMIPGSLKTADQRSVATTSTGNNTGRLGPPSAPRSKVMSPPAEEESNSCDCRGMSAIKLDDSQDSSAFQTRANTSSTMENDSSAQPSHDASSYNDHDIVYAQMRESISSRLPDKSYLFIAPNRYVFQGAEVYTEGSALEPTSPARNSGYDSDSPCLSSDEEEEDNETSVPYKKSSHRDCREGPSNTLPRTETDTDSQSSADSARGSSREKPQCP